MFGFGANVVNVTIKGDADPLKREMKSARTTVDAESKGMSDRLSSSAGIVKAAFAGAAATAIVSFAKDSVRAFSDLNESLNAVEVSYGDNAAGIKKLGEQAAQSIGLSNAEFNSFAVRMSAFTQQIAGDGGDVVGVLDEMSTRVADFASVMNLEVAEAAQVFQSGLAGESEPLRKYGVDVSAATIKTFAYANGIAKAGEELTEAQKVQARYGSIMEQTAKVQGDFANTAEDYANAQRIANAEMENAKARAGEALVPVAQLFEEFKLAGAKTLGILATGFQQLTGKISPTDAAIQEFQIHMGQSADTAEAALTIMQDYGEAASDLIPRLSLTTAELMRLRDADEEVLKKLGFTEKQIKDLAVAVDRELGKAMSEASDQVLRNYSRAQEDAADATEETTDAIDEQISALRAQADPMFGVLRASRDLFDAQDAYSKALKEGTATSAEAIAASEDIIDANLDMRQSFNDLRAQGINPTGEAARNMFRGMGLTDAQINAIFREFDRIERDYESRTFTTSISVPNWGFGDSGTAVQRGGRIFSQHGNIARARPGGVDMTVGEAGSDESVIPLNSEGARFMASTMMEALGMMGLSGGGGGMGGGEPFIIQLVLDRDVIAEVTREELIKVQKRNGSVGF